MPKETGTKDKPIITYGGVEGRRVDLWEEYGVSWMQLYKKGGTKNGSPQKNETLKLQ